MRLLRARGLAPLAQLIEIELGDLTDAMARFDGRLHQPQPLEIGSAVAAGPAGRTRHPIGPQTRSRPEYQCVLAPGRALIRVNNAVSRGR